MRRGTTPTHTFTLPFDVSIVADVSVIYQQDKVIIVKKDKSDCSLGGDTISLKLTREETLSFDYLKPVKIQMTIWTPAGDVMVSNIITKAVAECLDYEV